jgi:hypothetical protein
MLRVTRLSFVPLLAVALVACGQGANEPTATATISSDDVLQTAEAIAAATRSAAPPTPTPTPLTPTATEILETATQAATDTPLSPIVVADYVRSGPDEAFPAIDIFLQGDEADVLGRYQNSVNGVWWSIHRIGAGRDGWVWGGAVTLSGDAGRVPFLESPPTPEIEPTDKPTKTSEPSETPEPTETSAP